MDLESLVWLGDSSNDDVPDIVVNLDPPGEGHPPLRQTGSRLPQDSLSLQPTLAVSIR